MRIRSKWAGILLVVLAMAACQPRNEESSREQPGIDESEKLNQWFQRAFERNMQRHPMDAAYLGMKLNNGEWNNISEEFAKESLELAKAELDSLHTFDVAKLDEQAKLSYRLFEYHAHESIEKYTYRYHSYPVNQEEGLHTEVPTFLINVHQIGSLNDALDYISRIVKVKPLFADLVHGLKIREEKGIIAPKFIYPKVLAACKNVIFGQPFDKGAKTYSPIWADFTKKIDALENLDKKEKNALKNKAESALINQLKPAYDSLVLYLTELEKKATDTVGAWSLPNGDAYYKMAVRHYTTTDMSPEEVYALGEKEVARIHGEIREIMKKVNFKGDNVTDFFRYMTDPKNPVSFYPNTDKGRKMYLDSATKYIEDMKLQLDKLFITKPKADIVVKEVEKFRQRSAGTAFYDQPSLDGSRPGRFYVNLYDMTQSPVYQLEALAYHEGIPGHHMQISIAQELEGMPQFRKLDHSTAYVEGWGLYSERIPKEIGFYKDPYSDFGRLSMELMRAARLVVDPGIHYKHWTREEAITYFLTNTAEPPIECEHAIERYIVWPGQATAYKIGMNKILELRKKAQDELGDKFSIREFHDVILLSGALPLGFLEENVHHWIAIKMKGA